MTLEELYAHAQELDGQDPLAHYRARYALPKTKTGDDCIYLCGNSLGLMPLSIKDKLAQELEDWASYGVEGHTQARDPWLYYHHSLKAPLAKIVGAETDEVVPMNGLTANIHLLMASFYKPDGKRTKILVEADAFPSDLYAVESQVKWHGLAPEENMVKLYPRQGEKLLRKEDILQTIADLGDSLALVFLGGLNYYTGQFFDLKAITAAAHKVGALAGFDLAHAAGNVPLSLHDWQVDFAAWCSYKYMNAGPGATSAIFVHQKHGHNPDTPRLAGWWGHDEKERFRMAPGFVPMKGAEGWQLSNVPVLSMAGLKASLQDFEEAGMEALRRKSEALTGFFEKAMLQVVKPALQQSRFGDLSIITPTKPKERGCQLSLVIEKEGKAFYDALSDKGVIGDWRYPDVVRLAPVPLYNRFSDIAKLSELMCSIAGE